MVLLVFENMPREREQLRILIRQNGKSKFTIFRSRPDRPWGPPSFLYNGYRIFPGGRAAGVVR
jgi:hypothetical protein